MTRIIRRRPGISNTSIFVMATRYDFEVPIIIRDADEELRQPSVDPMRLSTSKYQLDWLLKHVGKGDRLVRGPADRYAIRRLSRRWRCPNGYWIQRLPLPDDGAYHRSSWPQYDQQCRQIQIDQSVPNFASISTLLTGWLDIYIRNRLFGTAFDPLIGENWRVLLLDDVAHGIAGVFATKLTELQASRRSATAEVRHRLMSEIKTIPVRSTAAVDVNKCIYPKLPVPSKGGGLERLFIEWADQDSKIEALIKVHEYRHDFLRRPYLKADGMPAQYSPDFLVRTSSEVYIVETKAQFALSDENVDASSVQLLPGASK